MLLDTNYVWTACDELQSEQACWQDGEQIFFQGHTLRTNNLFCLQNNVIVTSRKQRSFQATQKLKRHIETNVFSLPQIVFHSPVDKI